MKPLLLFARQWTRDNLCDSGWLGGNCCFVIADDTTATFGALLDVMWVLMRVHFLFVWGHSRQRFVATEPLEDLFIRAVQYNTERSHVDSHIDMSGCHHAVTYVHTYTSVP